MTWNMFIDDVRNPPDGEWIVCRSTDEALEKVRSLGFPDLISFDHDLGGEDTTMVFLRRLVNEEWDGISPPPDYTIHSANPVGVENIRAFMESWKRSASL